MGRSRRDLHIHGSAACGNLRKHDKLGNVSKWHGRKVSLCRGICGYFLKGSEFAGSADATSRGRDDKISSRSTHP